jgi:23S rRNA (guanine2445-N2)-methyltransferase / 23S rRNA (guanine2069-N7)-methyltransferase
MLDFFATTPLGHESVLAAELRDLGCNDIKEARSGVRFRGPLRDAYRALLWSRTASRVLLQLAEIDAHDADTLYRGIVALPWQEHLAPDGRFVISPHGGNDALHSGPFIAQRVKDGVVDAFRARAGVRPSVDLDDPDLRVHVRVLGASASVSIDLAGESLDRRGVRTAAGEAPIRETVAATMLLRARWPAIVEAGGALVDPMCGAGTIVLEAAAMATDLAPGLARKAWAHQRWRAGEPAVWRALVEEAAERAAHGRARAAGRTFVGFDADSAAIERARHNARVSGLDELVRFEARPLTEGVRVAEAGLVITNPPYGERLGDEASARAAMQGLGAWLREHAMGFDAAVLIADPRLGFALGLRAKRKHKIQNGNLECQLLCFKVEPEAVVTITPPDVERARSLAAPFLNRLDKNRRRLEATMTRDGVEAFRLYDADIPEFALAVDRYRDWVRVTIDDAPDGVDAQQARAREKAAVVVLGEALGVPRERVVLKRRRRLARGEQYEREDDAAHEFAVREGAARYLVNLHDFHDTGLFPDHRRVRARVAELARGRSLLNLFCYTATATVQAALAGAMSSTSIDVSATYLEWAQRNFELNRLGPRHELVRDDVEGFLQHASRRGRRWDVVLLDPPTFTTGAKMARSIDVERDQRRLIDAAMRVLAPRGVLIFSTHRRRFRMDEAVLDAWDVEDTSERMLPPDFPRKPRVLHVFEIRAR